MAQPCIYTAMHHRSNINYATCIMATLNSALLHSILEMKLLVLWRWIVDFVQFYTFLCMM